MLWKANIDVQFVAESSLALAHYVSGYVTKAEKSSMQEIWQDVRTRAYRSASGALAYGVYALESGLYEASDFLLCDHLNENQPPSMGRRVHATEKEP